MIVNGLGLNLISSQLTNITLKVLPMLMLASTLSSTWEAKSSSRILINFQKGKANGNHQSGSFLTRIIGDLP